MKNKQINIDINKLKNSEKEPSRLGFGKGLLKAGKKNKNIVSVEADLGKSTKSSLFRKEFPERSFNVGIAEQDMINTAAGLAFSGKIAFASTFAIFTERAFEQFRNAAARTNLNVNLIGSHAGFKTGPDGASAQCIEDMAIYRTLPNVAVICPADSVEAEKATIALSEAEGPSYMRTTRASVPILFDDSYKFKIGKGVVLSEGNDVAVIACGPQVYEALLAAEMLEKEDIKALVINMSTIKPIDKELVIKAAKTGAIVTAEDHNVIGGLGSAVSEVLVENEPVPVEKVGVKDTFGESGDPDDLYEKYGLTARHIYEACKQVIRRKK